MTTLFRIFNKVAAWLKSLPWETDDEYAPPQDERRTLTQEMDESARPHGLYCALYAEYGPDRMRTQLGRHDHEFCD